MYFQLFIVGIKPFDVIDHGRISDGETVETRLCITLIVEDPKRTDQNEMDSSPPPRENSNQIVRYESWMDE
jgi:hypothetical protein